MDKGLLEGDSEVESLDSLLMPVKETIEPLQKGENVLIEAGNQISVLKYEDAEIGSVDPLQIRVNRRGRAFCVGNVQFPRLDESYASKNPSKRIVAKARGEILGTHRLDFTFDDEFGIYFPSAEDHTDLYLTLAKKFGDGRIEKVFDNINVIADESLLVKRLKEVTRPEYFEQNVAPFLENRPTDLEMPKWVSNGNFLKGLVRKFKGSSDSRKPNYGRFTMLAGYEWLYNVAKGLKHGDFVYVGSKEEVYLFNAVKDGDVPLYMKGTYSISSEPALWFSNNYIGNMGKFDMEKSLFKGNDICDLTEYRTSGTPGFDGKPFIFSAIGRRQNHKNRVFIGEPDLITSDLCEAVSHFRTTDFKEFEDIVAIYPDVVNGYLLPVKPNDRFLY